VKWFFVVSSLAGVSISLSAQSRNSGPERPQYNHDKHCADFGYIVDHPSQGAACDQYNRNYQKAVDAYEAAKTNAEDATNAVDDINKLRSKDVDQQIDGLTGTARDINNRGNKNEASHFVTDKSASLISEMAHREKEILDNVGKSIDNNSQPASPTSDRSFSSNVHTLNVRTREEAGQLSLEQQFQNQANHSRTAPGIDSSDQNRGSEATLEGVFQNHENDILKSPSAVLAVARTDQQRQAALEEQRLQLERLARQEAIQEAKLKAEQQKADEERSREIDRELTNRRAERRAAWDSARHRWLQAMGVLPPDPPPSGYYPSLPSIMPLPSLPNSGAASASTTTSTGSHSGSSDCPAGAKVCP